MNEQPKVDAPVAEQPKPDAPVAEQPKPDAPLAEQPKPDAPVAEQPKPDAPLAEQPKPDAPVAEQPKPDAPVEKAAAADQAMQQKELFVDPPLSYSDQFMQDHAGRIISDNNIAIIEMIANAYDAGATLVDIEWPQDREQPFSVTDNGTGMTPEELEKRWTTFNYKRAENQGTTVVFPPGTPKTLHRIAFGHSGKGRYAPFCFANSYTVETEKEGKRLKIKVVLTNGGDRPFRLLDPETAASNGHGTRISGIVERNLMRAESLRQLIGTKFLVDSTFKINLNGIPIALLDLAGIETTPLTVAPHGDIKIHFIEHLRAWPYIKTARNYMVVQWQKGRGTGLEQTR